MLEQSGILVEGARRVWRRQRIVWWMFVVNVVLALGAALPFWLRLGQVTDHSFASQRLVNGYDLGAVTELAGNPDVGFGSRMSESHAAVLVFVVFTLLLTGGILTAYSEDRKLTTGEFFQACGAFFWRWVRLLILMLIVLVPVALLSSALFTWSGKLILDAAGEMTGYWATLGVTLLTLFLAMLVRVWFDMAQVRAVIEGERSMVRNCGRSFKLTFSNLGGLFWLYFRISLLAWLGLGLGLWLWGHLTGHSSLSFVMLELVLLWWVGTRLWQRASETVWYQRRVAALEPSLAFVPPPVAVPEAQPTPSNPLPTT